MAVSSFLVRAMEPGDIPQVVAIEAEAFPTVWPPTTYRRELVENRLARYLVAVERPLAPAVEIPSRGWRAWARQLLGRDAPTESVQGFVGLWLLKEEAHIVTIAVHQPLRRRGIGERLLIAATELAQAERQEVVTLECRASNLPARSLYEKYGYRVVGTRPRYYSDNNEDAVIMTTDPLHWASYQALFQERLAEHRRRHPELYEA